MKGWERSHSLHLGKGKKGKKKVLWLPTTRMLCAHAYAAGKDHCAPEIYEKEKGKGNGFRAGETQQAIPPEREKARILTHRCFNLQKSHIETVALGLKRTFREKRGKERRVVL